MVLPGPEAQQLATYIGWLLHRTPGGILAGVLFVLPSLVLLIFLSWIYVSFGSVPAVAGVLYGVKPAVAAIVVQAAHRIGSRSLHSPALWTIAGSSFLLTIVWTIPFPVIVAGAALTGFALAKIRADLIRPGTAHRISEGQTGQFAIDDHSPVPDHATMSWPRFALVCICGVVLWAAPLGLLFILRGWHDTFTQMGWFFTKAALLTFGGAYAVLPYVHQSAVTHYGWLSPLQMMDGLALGESTPGPLIMVVAFVGYLGGVSKGAGALDSHLLAGAFGAVIATWFTFLPSFVFILAGGPWVESTRGDLKLTAPLTAITAAVVGVITNLALLLFRHAAFPTGFGSIDRVSTAIFVLALTALFRFNVGVLPVIAICGLLGFLAKANF